jgi:glutamate N-acetyltransferase / amino-acid N-acetyltransferase
LIAAGQSNEGAKQRGKRYSSPPDAVPESAADRDATMTTNFHDVPRFPRGFRCASRNVGLKPSAKDLALFVSAEDCAAAAVFTRNHFPGAPIVLGRETIRGGLLRGVVVNSRISNVATGAAGLEDASRMAAAAAEEIGTTAGRVLVSSTGVIGVRLPIARIEVGLRGMAAELSDDPLVGAEGIMTTDTHPKALSCDVDGATLTIVAKGSGMIAPDMATMLAYIFTDARFDSAVLDAMLRRVVADSFNMVSVDTDTSTSDTCAILANGLGGPVDGRAFEETLRAACVRMTEILARDGEGATKLIRATVRGAASKDDARRVAKSLVDSPLIKTMAFGADPNVGRILMAIGKCADCRIEPEHTSATLCGIVVVNNGTRADFDDAAVRERLAGDPVDIVVELGVGDASATAYGCDLTAGYVTENAAYYSS